MTEPLFFDNDCLSAFLWVGDESLLVKLYPGRIVIPRHIYIELSYPRVDHLRQRVDMLLNSGDAVQVSIELGTEAYSIYRKLTSAPDPGHKIIGSGEAAAIALAKCCNGILASNNLKDIAVYIREFDLKHLTTGEILREALSRGLIEEAEGNDIWSKMLQKRRKLGFPSFSDFLASDQLSPSSCGGDAE